MHAFRLRCVHYFVLRVNWSTPKEADPEVLMNKKRELVTTPVKQNR